MAKIRTHIGLAVGRIMVGLLLLFPLGPHIWTGVWLCIEEGGRIHVEGITDSDCAPTELLAQRETHPIPLAGSTVWTTQEQHVETPVPCIDVPLLLNPSDGSAHLLRGQSAGVAIVASMLWVPWQLSPKQTFSGHSLAFSSFFSHLASPLRTVILRL